MGLCSSIKILRSACWVLSCSIKFYNFLYKGLGNLLYLLYFFWLLLYRVHFKITFCFCCYQKCILLLCTDLLCDQFIHPDNLLWILLESRKCWNTANNDSSLPSFQSLYLFPHFVLLHWLGSPICWIEGVRVGILFVINFKGNIFNTWYICCESVNVILY